MSCRACQAACLCSNSSGRRTCSCHWRGCGDRLVIRPLAHGTASDAEQVGKLTISQAKTLSGCALVMFMGISLLRLATVSSPLSATVCREVLRALDYVCLGG